MLKSLFYCFFIQLVLAYPVFSQHSLLWKIEKEGYYTSYLFGSFHIYPSIDFTIPNEVKEALRQSKKIILELQIEGNPKNKKELAAPIMTAKKLGDFLKPHEKVFLDSLLQTQNVQFSFVEHWYPYLLNVFFYKSFLQNKNISFDFELLKWATKHKLQNDGLETVEDQIAVFKKIKYKHQIQILKSHINQYPANKEKYRNWIDLYNSKNIEKIYIETAKDLRSKRERKLFLNKRNQKWIKKMIDFTKNQPTFFAVGAAHLGGKKGLLALLRKKGFTVTPISNKN